MRLHPEPPTEEQVAASMKLLFGPAEIPGAEGELLMPIHQLPLQSRLDILESLPTFNARGLEGESGADAAPRGAGAYHQRFRIGGQLAEGGARGGGGGGLLW